VREAGAVAAAFVAGIATSWLQTVLPLGVASLANSAGTWCALAFLLAGVARRTWTAALVASSALLALVAGYYLTAGLRGFAVGVAGVGFWAVAALLAGPVLGVGRCWLGADGARRVLGALVLPVLLVAEGTYGLLVVAATTSAAYWSTEVVVGLVLAVVLLLPRSLTAITGLVRNT
jgi:hypothetical protein